MILYSILTPPPSTKSSHKCNCRMIIETSFCLLLNNMKTASHHYNHLTKTRFHRNIDDLWQLKGDKQHSTTHSAPLYWKELLACCTWKCSFMPRFMFWKQVFTPQNPGHSHLISKNRRSCFSWTIRWPKTCSWIRSLSWSHGDVR